MKIAAYIGGLLGLALLLALIVRADSGAMLHTLAIGGWTLLWLSPYRLLYLLLYTIGWFYILRPYDPDRRAGLGYLFWVTIVREAIDRLLPVASVGGGVAGVRLLRWRGVAGAPAAATVIVEILLTLIVSYLFTAVGLALLLDFSGGADQHYHRLLLGFLLSLPAPVIIVLLLRYGAVFARLEALLRPLVGASASAEDAAALDQEIRACFHRLWSLCGAAGLQLIALFSGAFEIWFALRLFRHPVSASAAIMLESLSQALRHLAFVVPAGLGVQEAGLVLFGHALGISSEMALAVSMAKRLREVVCGLPALLSWQWMEVRRLQRPIRNSA